MNPPRAAGRTIGLWVGLREVYARMSPSRRRQFFAVLVLMGVGGIAELATIGAVMPFLALLASSATSGRQVWLLSISQRFNSDPVLLSGTIFIIAAVLAGLLRLELARSSRRFIFSLGHELNVEIQRRVLLQPFSFHIDRNTSTLLSALQKTEGLVFYVLLPLMHAVTAAVIGLFIVALLFLVAPLTTLGVGAALIATYAVISAGSRNRLAANSAVLGHAQDDRLQVVQESLGGIRDVIIDNSQAMYLDEFRRIDAKLAEARSTTEFISIAPRYVIEVAGMVAIAAIAVITARQTGGIVSALPILGALALGAQRLLPLVQQVYAGWTTLEGQRSVFAQVVDLLSLPVRDAPAGPAMPLELREAITLEGVSFTYPTRGDAALNEIGMAIPQGAMLALIGPTGSGKSTLVDVLMGLLQPDSGRITIDGTRLTDTTQARWHRSVAHVPQSIFLADSSIARNIALGLPDEPADEQRIVRAAKTAQLHEFITSLPSGYDTYVGERGVRLSGGQRQRLGIARAVYKGAPIMILDEATSALDEETERSVIGALEELRREGRTIIIVAHRLSTLRHCDLVARLEHGRLVRFGAFSEIIGSNESAS